MSVYFIYAPSLELVKIGFSVDPYKRLSKIRSDSPVPLVMLSVIDGGKEVEAELHDRFSELRTVGEWFRHEGELEEFAQSLSRFEIPERKKTLTGIIARDCGVSKSYASMIATGSRNPPRPLAIHILRTTGWRHEVLADLTDEQLAMLEAIEPWKARA